MLWIKGELGCVIKMDLLCSFPALHFYCLTARVGSHRALVQPLFTHCCSSSTFKVVLTACGWGLCALCEKCLFDMTMLRMSPLASYKSKCRKNSDRPDPENPECSVSGDCLYIRPYYLNVWPCLVWASTTEVWGGEKEKHNRSIFKTHKEQWSKTNEQHQAR